MANHTKVNARLKNGWIQVKDAWGWEKPCCACKQMFPITSEFFHLRANGSPRPRCKVCVNEKRSKEMKAFRVKLAAIPPPPPESIKRSDRPFRSRKVKHRAVDPMKRDLDRLLKGWVYKDEQWTKPCTRCRRKFPATAEFFYTLPSGNWNARCKKCCCALVTLRRRQKKEQASREEP